MDKRVVKWLLVCVMCSLFSVSGAEQALLGKQVLLAEKARLHGKKIQLEEGTQIGYWTNGASAEWMFKADPAGAQDLRIYYSAVNSCTLEVWLDEAKIVSTELPSTESFDQYVDYSLGDMVLSNGMHKLRLVCKGKGFCINLRTVTFVAQSIPNKG